MGKEIVKKLSESLVLAFILLSASECLATSYTWNGTTTAWGLNTNWSPVGVPGTGDDVTIVNATAQPLLNATQSITNFTITSGVLNLNSFTLTITGTATYTAGTINNGTITSTGTSTTFSGTVFGAVVNATSGSVMLNGSTFNNTVTVNQTGASNVLSNGGNTFNGTTTVTNSGSGYMALGNNTGDVFAVNVTFNNTGTNNLYVAYNSSGNQFNGTTTFTNGSTALGIYSNAGIAGVAAYNGNIVVNNTGASGGVFFGTLGGTATLATTRTITVGGTGFTTGRLLIRDFTQTGTTAQSLTLTGTGLIETGPSAIFNGDATITSPQVLLNGTRFNGAASVTKNGATQNNSNGGNVFVGAATLTNTGSGIFLLGNVTADTFNDLALVNTGTSQIQLATNGTGHAFNGNVTLRQTTGTGIFFGSGTGSSTLAATKTLSTAPGFTGGTLNLARFTQTGATAQTLNISGASGLLQMGPSVSFDGAVTFTSTQVLLNGCTFNGATTITKNGATTNTGTGGNTFNGVTVLNCSGSGSFELGDTSPEIFNTDLTVNNTGSGRVQIGINSAGNTFNGATIINHGGTNVGNVNTVIVRNTGCTATFNGPVTFNCTNGNTASGIVISNDGAVTFNANVTVTTTNGRGILFGQNTGSSTLASGFTISAGTYNTGTLTIRKFTQNGSTAQNITLTGTADLTLGNGSIFNGSSTFIAPQLFLNGVRFNSTAALTKNGATANSSTGGNMFNDVTTITSSGTGLLRLANGGSDDVNADITFVNSGSGGLEPAYANTTTLAGNVTINSATTVVFGANGGTTTFDGGSSQTISKTGAIPTFNQLRINKTANDVTLNTEIIVGTLLTLTNRYFISSSANPVTLVDNATVTGAANASFVSGPVRKTGDDAFTFPVGKSGFYRPITMANPGSSTDQFSGEYFLADPNPSYSVTSKDASINHLSRCEYWMLNRTAGSSNVLVTLSWNTTSCGVTNLSQLVVAAWDGTTWKDQQNGLTTGTTSAGTVRSLAAVSIFGPFTLGSTTTNNPLPITLTSFTALANGNSVALNWTTATEVNNDKFIVERTADGTEFKEVSIVSGAGNSTATLRYATKDLQPLTGTSYYRLKQVDYDGQFTYSKLVPVFVESVGSFNFTVYPNPSSGTACIAFGDVPVGSEEILVTVYTLTGTKISSQIVRPADTATVGTESKLTPGVYIVSVVCGSRVHYRKLIVN